MMAGCDLAKQDDMDTRRSGRIRVGLSLLLPFVVLVVVPVVILLSNDWPRVIWQLTPVANTTLSAVGLLFVLFGLVLMGSTIRLFAQRGEGTLAPWDPPKHLVVRGIYRHVRNPMHSGLFAVLFGESFLLRSNGLLILAAVVVILHLFYIPLSEERGLEARFGEAYRVYKRNVPRWIPRVRPWEAEGTMTPPD
jgi:protein-S-isoprenylcysteine O-methyltransferase Ste14